MTDQELLHEIIDSWKSGRNALIYGPPGTGKTRILSELWQRVHDTATSVTTGDLANVVGEIVVGDDPALPLTRARDAGTGTSVAPGIDIPTPAKAVWVTFHQSYAYEDFVLGLRPEPCLFKPDGASSEHAVTELKPWMGVLMEAVVALRDGEYKSVVIFIDEINRGNAARIFGEMLTFLDFDYRSGGTRPVPVPVRQVRYLPDGKSEPVYRANGEITRLDSGFEFPRDIYIVATMNSVDRAAVPIDSALARRFDRVEMRPDLTVPATLWDVELDQLAAAVADWENLTAHQTAILLLDQLNNVISEDFGLEFELGHGLLLGIGKDDPDPWMSLATAWDDLIYPQLEDRYAGNPARLIEILKVAEPPTTGKYAWKTRIGLNGKPNNYSLGPVKLSQLAATDLDIVKRSFQWLALGL